MYLYITKSILHLTQDARGVHPYFSEGISIYFTRMNWFLRIWSHLLKKSLMEQFVFLCSVICGESSWVFILLVVLNLFTSFYWSRLFFKVFLKSLQITVLEKALQFSESLFLPSEYAKSNRLTVSIHIRKYSVSYDYVCTHSYTWENSHQSKTESD